MIVKVREDLIIDTYYEGVMFVKDMEKYKGKLFVVTFIREHPYKDNIVLINLDGVDEYNFSPSMLEFVDVKEDMNENNL